MVFYAVPDVIERGQIIDVEKNWKGRGYDGYTLAAPISIGGAHHVAVVIVHRDGNSNRFYLQEVALTDSLRDVSAFKTGASAASQSAVEPSGADRRGALKTLLSDIFAVNDASKAVDANGEPLVVYHGTASSFDAFDTGAIGSNYGADSKGLFFTIHPAIKG